MSKIESCGKRIDEALTIRNMKQSELCKLANVPKSSLSLYLKGAYEPKQDRIYSMARVLNVSDMWLMGYDVPKDREQKTEKPLISEGLSLEGITETQRLIIEAILKMPVDRQRALAEILGLSE
jgi:transcriptional regulator with XRE-family HTH domain